MFYYLASYPRSGSALTQSILWQCFGIGVQFVENSSSAPAENNSGRIRYKPDPVNLNKLHLFFGPRLKKTIEELQEIAGNTDRPVVAKTHDIPKNDVPAIVVVRDGRAVVRSYAKFRTTITGTPHTIEDIINIPKRNWSDHINAWLDHEGRKLVLRYEDLREPSDETLGKISAFLSVPRVGDFTVKLDELNLLRPWLINQGRNDEGIELIEQKYGDLFWSRHGEAMRRLGYRRSYVVQSGCGTGR